MIGEQSEMLNTGIEGGGKTFSGRTGFIPAFLLPLKKRDQCKISS